MHVGRICYLLTTPLLGTTRLLGTPEYQQRTAEPLANLFQKIHFSLKSVKDRFKSGSKSCKN